MIPLLVTRADDDARALAGKLGPHAIPAPCLAFVALAPPRPDLPGADLLVASPRAVGPLAQVGLDPSWRVLALAPTTARALLAAGLPVHLAVPGGGAELAAAARPGPVLCATSDLGGDEVLRVRPDALLWMLYRTVCPASLPDAALAALAGPFDVLFTSPSAVLHFDVLAPGAILRARRVLCHGATTVAEVLRHGRAGELTPLP
ncbi:MAG: uroporphyrinogen-III synthase [Pseudomonadota bacterium]|nr:uroporphyrinogen-III synthase [Pseudomonadota bacterium]